MYIYLFSWSEGKVNGGRIDHRKPSRCARPSAGDEDGGHPLEMSAGQDGDLVINDRCSLRYISC